MRKNKVFVEKFERKFIICGILSMMLVNSVMPYFFDKKEAKKLGKVRFCQLTK